MPHIYSGTFKGKTFQKILSAIRKGEVLAKQFAQMDMLEEMLYQELTEGMQFWCLIFSKQNKLLASQEVWLLLLSGWANTQVELLWHNHFCKVLKLLPRLASNMKIRFKLREHVYILCLLIRAFSTFGQRNSVRMSPPSMKGA